MKKEGIMKSYPRNIVLVLPLFGLLLLSIPLMVEGAPPIQTEEAIEADQEAEKKTEEEEAKEKEAAQIKATIRDIRRRQEKDERSLRVRASVFPSLPPSAECTAADRARTRLEKVTGEGGVVILGDINIASKNEANVDKNEGSLHNEVNVNIVNQDSRRC